MLTKKLNLIKLCSDIETSLSEYQQAHILVHNLKGLAGNLAATNLQAAAVEIEKLVEGNQAASSSTEQLNQNSGGFFWCLS